LCQLGTFAEEVGCNILFPCFEDCQSDHENGTESGSGSENESDHENGANWSAEETGIASGQRVNAAESETLINTC
jgi:hypothetical protein